MKSLVLDDHRLVREGQFGALDFPATPHVRRPGMGYLVPLLRRQAKRGSYAMFAAGLEPKRYMVRRLRAAASP